MSPIFTPDNVKAAYQLRYHFGWKTHQSKSFFDNQAVRSSVQSALDDVVAVRGYHTLASEIESKALRALLSLKVDDSPI